jgi:hypothetical protein
LVSLIRSERDPVIQTNLCQIAASLPIPDDPLWLSLLSFARELLSSSASYAVGLDLLVEVDAGFPDNAEFYFHALRGLAAEDRAVRLSSLRLLSRLVRFVAADPSPAIGESCADFHALVDASVGRAYADAREATLLFDFMRQVCAKGFRCFVDCHTRFVESMLPIIANRAINPYARLPAARAVAATFPHSVGCFGDDLLGAIFEAAAGLAVELAAINPEADDFMFVRDYLDDPDCGLWAVLHDDAPAAHIFPLARTLIGDDSEATTLVGLALFEGLVAGPNFCEAQSAAIVAVVADCLARGGAAVAEAAAGVVLGMCDALGAKSRARSMRSPSH